MTCYSSLFRPLVLSLLFISFSIVKCSFYTNFIRHGYMGITPKGQEDSPLLDPCGQGRGVCIQFKACPWERLVSGADGECLHQRASVCCQVARARMPVDIFDYYSKK